jgi:hypothetical protein
MPGRVLLFIASAGWAASFYHLGRSAGSLFEILGLLTTLSVDVFPVSFGLSFNFGRVSQAAAWSGAAGVAVALALGWCQRKHELTATGRALFAASGAGLLAGGVILCVAFADARGRLSEAATAASPPAPSAVRSAVPRLRATGTRGLQAALVGAALLAALPLDQFWRARESRQRTLLARLSWLAGLALGAALTGLGFYLAARNGLGALDVLPRGELPVQPSQLAARISLVLNAGLLAGAGLALAGALQLSAGLFAGRWRPVDQPASPAGA